MMMKAFFYGLLGLGLSGQMAIASTFTIENYNLRLRYEGTSFTNVLRIDPETDEGSYFDIAPGEFDYGIAEYTHLAVGDVVSLVATISFPDSDEPFPDFPGNGGTAPVCDLGGRDCTNITAAYRFNNTVAMDHTDRDHLRFSPTVGTVLTHEFWGYEYPVPPNTYGIGIYDWQEAQFTVLEVLAPAPIPLPAGVLLLPAALAGFTMLRRRRSV